MSKKEIERSRELSNVLEGKITQALAAKKLKISDRQIRRLLRRFEEEGHAGLISKKRGQPSNRVLDAEFKAKVLSLVEKNYQDFGPTLANEYLKKHHNLHLSIETLRRWMSESHLWTPRNLGEKKTHPPRARRLAFGELIQIDGSHHAWFEDRGPKCVLMVFVDDATSAITSMHFSESESLNAYYKALEKHCLIYGRPLAMYGDRCSVLTPRIPKNSRDSTQFQKALKELDVDLILALSPQAKGKVERANRTLQDRLVKELRIRGISTIEEANKFLEEYRSNYNLLFSKKPAEQIDAHRSLEGIFLEQVLCIREIRTLSKDFVVQFRNTFYKVSSQEHKMHFFKGAEIEIRELLNGKKIALFKNKLVNLKPLAEISTPELDEKEVATWKVPKKRSVSPMHPYKHRDFIHKITDAALRHVV